MTSGTRTSGTGGWSVRSTSSAYVVRPESTALQHSSPESTRTSRVWRTQACLDQYFSADRLAEGKPGSLLIAVPLHADRATILREVSKLMDEAEQCSGSNAHTGQFKFLVNKIRRQTLDEATGCLGKSGCAEAALVCDWKSSRDRGCLCHGRGCEGTKRQLT